jgi:hypothetical protein
MMLRKSVWSLALAITFCIPALAQMDIGGTTGFHTVACIKVSPEKAGDFHAWAASDLHKLAQERVDSGALSGWFLLKSVEPQGKAAECDYLSISMYPGAPPEPMGLDALGAALKKAGLTMSAQQFVDRRDALTKLISNSLFQNRALVGSMKTGDYLVVNYMKAPDVEEWVAFEKKVWQPMAEALVKDGVTAGWSLNVQVLPGGSDLRFQGVTVDFYSSWDAIFKPDPQFAERFRRVHPDMDFGTTFEKFGRLRTIEAIQLLSVADMVAPAK